MRLSMTVNKFEVSAYTEGHPLWTTIKYEGNEIARIHHSEIRDLTYALDRLRAQIVNALPPAYKHEAE